MKGFSDADEVQEFMGRVAKLLTDTLGSNVRITIVARNPVLENEVIQLSQAGLITNDSPEYLIQFFEQVIAHQKKVHEKQADAESRDQGAKELSRMFGFDESGQA